MRDDDQWRSGTSVRKDRSSAKADSRSSRRRSENQRLLRHAPNQAADRNEMSREVVFVVEPDVGKVTVEISQISGEIVDDLATDLGSPVNLNCGRPAVK